MKKHPDLSEQAVEKLNVLKTHITADPLRIDMDRWIYYENGQDIFTIFPKCGTIGCIAGWLVVLFSKTKKLPTLDISSQAQYLLEIDSERRDNLFIKGFWPVTFSNQYKAALGPAARAKVVCDRIDYFIEQMA